VSATALREGTTQNALSSGLKEHQLPHLKWLRQADEFGEKTGYPGVAELGGVQANALLNDLENAGITAQVRVNPHALAALLADDHRPTRGVKVLLDGKGDPCGIEIEGPARTAWIAVAPESRSPGPRPVRWRFTTAWSDVPPSVAYWFFMQQRTEDPRLGAGYYREAFRKLLIDGVEKVQEYRQYVPPVWERLRAKYEDDDRNPAPSHLLEVRLPGDREPGETDSGLIVPTSVTYATRESDEAARLRAELAELRAAMVLPATELSGDEDEDTELAADPPAKPKRAR